MKPRNVFLLNSIDVNRGGLTHASLRQDSTFDDNGYDTQILTYHYEHHFPVSCINLRSTRKSSEKVIIRNMFEEMALYSEKEKVNIRKMKVKISDYAKDYAIAQRKKHKAYRLYNNGLYDKYIALRD